MPRVLDDPSLYGGGLYILDDPTLFAASGLALDNAPASLVRGSAAVFIVSNPSVPPTVVTVTSGSASLTVDSVTGSDPYTINCTVPSTVALQHSVTGYAWTITVDAEFVDTSLIPLNEPAGWDYTDLVSPVTTPGSILEGYTALTPVTEDQVVFENVTSPGGISVTVDADGTINFGVEPEGAETVNRYVIKADGTVGATEPYVAGEIPVIPAVQSNEGQIAFFRSQTGSSSYNFNDLALAYYKQVTGANSASFNDAQRGAQKAVGFVGLSPADWRNFI